MLIAVEGMDGVGKTEVSKYICEKFGFKFIDKPLHYFYGNGESDGYSNLSKFAQGIYDIKDNVIKSWYIALGNIYAVRMFQNEDVVLDRHFVSNYYWNGGLDSDPVFKTMIDICGKPDLTILLYATTKTRMERIMHRNINDADLFDPEKKDDGYKKMIQFLEKFNLPYVLINTENVSLDDVKTQVENEVLKLKQSKVLVKENEN